MAKDDIYVGSGREGVDDSCETAETITRNEVEFPANEKERRLKGLLYLVAGFLLATLSFWVACWMIHAFEIGWFLKALIAVAFSVLVIKAYDKATGEIPTPMSGPVAHFTIILFVLCLFTGYQNAHGKSAGAFFDGFFFAKLNESALVEEKEENKASSSESGTVKTGDIWFASHMFSRGDKVKIEVEYNAVQMTGGRILKPGVYEEVLDGNGQIMFEGIATNPSKITITY